MKTMDELKRLAQDKGVSLSKKEMDRPALIKAIQRAEGNFDCFATASHGFCDQWTCAWRGECVGKPSATQTTSPKKTRK